MIGRLAFRSLTTHPVRSAVLAAGFGAGVGVMAILLGVAEVVLEQAQSPALVGGGDVLIRLNRDTPARLVLAGTLQADALRDRMRVAAPYHTTDLFLVPDRPETAARSTGSAASDSSPAPTPSAGAIRVAARGGIPSLEHAMGDPETGGIAEWRDTPADVAWTHETPERFLRYIDRFHAIPDAPRWENSWAEWLYFNGRSAASRFYLTFLVGPRTGEGLRAAGVRLQIERNGRMENFDARAELTDEEVSRAPELTIGRNRIRLDGMTYRIDVDLESADGRRATGSLTLQASAGNLVPPLEIAGAQGWQTGYVVPVLAGPLSGALNVDGDRVPLDEGTGYHDHNWGFWEGVSWQWGQVQHEDLSFVFGRVFPPAEAADPERLPVFFGALGPDGPLGYATEVRITETNAEGRPERLTIEASGPTLDLTLGFDVESLVTNRGAGPLANELSLVQMRGQYSVSGRVGERDVSFTAPGSAETWR